MATKVYRFPRIWFQPVCQRRLRAQEAKRANYENVLVNFLDELKYFHCNKFHHCISHSQSSHLIRLSEATFVECAEHRVIDQRNKSALILISSLSLIMMNCYTAQRFRATFWRVHSYMCNIMQISI